MEKSELARLLYESIDNQKLKETAGFEFIVGELNNQLYIMLVNRETREEINLIENKQINIMKMETKEQLLADLLKGFNNKNRKYTYLSEVHTEGTQEYLCLFTSEKELNTREEWSEFISSKEPIVKLKFV